jgi:hypothetical protein
VKNKLFDKIKEKFYKKILQLHKKIVSLKRKNINSSKAKVVVVNNRPDWFILPQLKTTMLLDEKAASYLRSNIVDKSLHEKCLAYHFVEQIKLGNLVPDHTPNVNNIQRLNKKSFVVSL